MVCAGISGWAQQDKFRSPETGDPYSLNFGPADFNAPEATWGTIQDDRGIIYVGNQAGILEFDGVSWRLIATPAKSYVRTFARDPKNGRIYVGALGDFGYLAPDGSGTMQFVSLLARHPELPRGFTDIWSTVWSPEGVYFLAHEGLFRYVDDKTPIRFWGAPSKRRFTYASYIHGQLYISDSESGLERLGSHDEKPVPVKGFEQFSNSRRLVLVPYDGDKKILVADRGPDDQKMKMETPLFLYDGEKLVPFRSEADDILRTHKIVAAQSLGDGSFAIATSGGGVVILGPDGKLLWQVDQKTGLLDDLTYSLYFNPTQSQNRRLLWVNSSEGVSRVSLPPPLSLFMKDTNGAKKAFARAFGSLYLGTTSGAYRLRGTPGQPPEFHKLEGTGNFQANALVTVESHNRTWLLMGTTSGLYTIEGETAHQIIAHNGDRPYSVMAMVASKKDPGRVYVALENGLASVRLDEKDHWQDEKSFTGDLPGARLQEQSMVEDDAGHLWVGTESSGVFRVDPAPAGSAAGAKAEVQQKMLPLSDGSAGAKVFFIDHKLLFATNDLAHLYRFDESTGKFSELGRDDPLASAPSNPHLLSFGFKEDAHGNIWTCRGRELVYLQKRGDTYEPTKAYPTALGSLSDAFVDSDGVSWFGTLKTVIRYDAAREQNVAQAADFRAMIRRVVTTPESADGQQVEKDIFGGAGQKPQAKLPWAERSLRFDFAAFGSPDPTEIEYETRLEGLDKDFSPPSTMTSRVFQRLPPGKYTFHVRATNFLRELTEDHSKEDDFTFTIAPPWYRTWAAYAGCVVLFALILWLLLLRERARAQRRTAQLEAEARALERKVEEATSEIRKQAADLRTAYNTAESLSEIGREITSSLNLDKILYKVYESVSRLADASVFGVGILRREQQKLEYPLAILKGRRLDHFERDLQNRDQFAVWCIENRQPLVMNDVETERTRYISGEDHGLAKLDLGEHSLSPASMIYVPLTTKDDLLGIITLQSFEKNAYAEYHVNLLKSLASYTSIAIVNARLFEEAEQARAAAVEADASKSSFLSTVSHELRTPLTSVIGFAKIIRRRLTEKLFPLITRTDPKTAQTMKQVNDNLDVVVSEGERLTNLINEVLDLAKIESGKIEWRVETLTAAEIIERGLAATSSLVENKPVTLITQVAPDLPGFIGDRDRLIQVLINLISNAVKFTKEGSITCSARQENGEIVIGVTDTGLGIAEEDQSKVFEKFKQVGDTLTDKPKGTGLGLPICKEIVEHHNGRIGVHSEPGKGSTFWFTLPVKVETAQLAFPPTTSYGSPLNFESLIQRLRDSMEYQPENRDGQHQSILVVDDDEHIRELLRQEFHEAGYEVRLAAGGPEALSMVRVRKPSLVLLDVLMPEMSGFDVAAVLKNDPATSDIPIIMLSIVQDEERGHRLGIDRYLTKPVDTNLLLHEVDVLMMQGKSRKKVMIVDEDASAVKSLMEVLQVRGYQVFESTGNDLIEQAISTKPDVIILNSVLSRKAEIMQTLRFEKGLDNLLFLIYDEESHAAQNSHS